MTLSVSPPAASVTSSRPRIAFTALCGNESCAIDVNRSTENLSPGIAEILEPERAWPAVLLLELLALLVGETADPALARAREVDRPA